MLRVAQHADPHRQIDRLPVLTPEPRSNEPSNHASRQSARQRRLKANEKWKAWPVSRAPGMGAPNLVSHDSAGGHSDCGAKVDVTVTRLAALHATDAVARHGDRQPPSRVQQ